MKLVFCILAILGPAASADAPLRQSTEPFIVNPRFCLGIGNACERQPVPC